jgi:hypothetical protein
MDDSWSLEDDIALLKEAEGIYSNYRDDGDPGQIPQPSRQPASGSPSATQRPGNGGAGGMGKLLVPALAALVVGWIAWKASGKPLVGLIAALVAALIAYFLFSRSPAPAAQPA